MSPVELIFINWNSADLLMTAVSTLKNVKCPVKIRVVDNGSADDSCERIRQELPEADLVEMGWNAGFAGAVNAGLQRVTGRFALILNTDIEFVNDVPTLLSEALAANDKAALACPKLIRPDGSLQAAVVPIPTLFSELTNRSAARRRLKYDRDKTCAVESVVGPCMAVDMEKLKALGIGQGGQFFDERFFFFLEETDFCKRINDAGGEVLYVPEADLIHLQGESANKRPVGARVQFHESRFKYFAKHYGSVGVFFLWFFGMIRLLINALAQTLTGLLLFWKRGKYFDKAYVYWALLIWYLCLGKPRWSFDKR